MMGFRFVLVHMRGGARLRGQTCARVCGRQPVQAQGLAGKKSCAPVLCTCCVHVCDVFPLCWLSADTRDQLRIIRLIGSYLIITASPIQVMAGLRSMARALAGIDLNPDLETVNGHFSRIPYKVRRVHACM